MTRRRKFILTAFGVLALAVAVTGTAIGGSAPPAEEMPLPESPGTRAFGQRAVVGTEVVPGLTLPDPTTAAAAGEAAPTATIYRNGRYEQVVSVRHWVEGQVVTGIDGKPYTLPGGWQEDIDATHQQPAIATSASPDGPFVAAAPAPPPAPAPSGDPSVDTTN